MHLLSDRWRLASSDRHDALKGGLRLWD